MAGITHITAVVLAAGLSSRMGDTNKLLHEIAGKSMLVHVLDRLEQSSVDRIILVLGHEAPKIEREIDKAGSHVQKILNADYLLGMSTSISKGAKALHGTSACMICLGDMPYIESGEYEQLLSDFRSRGSASKILIPKFRNRTGNPVIFGENYFSELSSLAANDRGARNIIEKYSTHLLYFEMASDHVLRDIDTLPQI